MASISQATKETIAQAFFETGLLKFGQFTLKSGLVSPFYNDLRKAQSHPNAFHAVVDAYSEMLADVDDSVLLAGIPEAGTPLAAAVGYKLKRVLIQPRKVVKEHGTKSAIEGDFNQGDSVVLLDDVITKGDSKIEAIQQIEKAGLKVEKMIVLIDLQVGGLDLVRSTGHTIEAGITMTELADALLKLGKIDQEQHSKVLNFINSNRPQ